MSKFFICAVLLVSVACAQNGESEEHKKLLHARAQCVASIHRASGLISQKYYATVEQLANVEDGNAMFEIVREATDKLKSLVSVARKEASAEIAADVRTAFGDLVHCHENLAILVSEITYRASEQLDEFLATSVKSSDQSTRCRKCMEREIDG